MKNKFKKAYRFISDFIRYFGKELSGFFYRGFKARLLGKYSIFFIRSFASHLCQFPSKLSQKGLELHHIGEDQIKSLQKTAFGLHSLLPFDPRFSYSILMVVNDPRPRCFEESLQSALNQSAPSYEILIGLMKTPSNFIKEILADAVETKKAKVTIFEFFHETKRLKILDQLAKKATGNFLFILKEEDWIRPDLLFRYEQTLRVFSHPENCILYCNVNSFSETGYFIPESEYRPPNDFVFPYIFKPFNENGWLISDSLWKAVGGFSIESKGAEYENLLLSAELAGAKFQKIPFNLYSSRISSQNCEKCSHEGFLQALQNYATKKKLHWTWGSGYLEGSVRAIPALPEHFIQAVIPFKDQKELTLKCVRSLLRQKNVRITITAIDNCSDDKTIGEEIQELGGEVILVKEPFNYSRLNNLAVKTTVNAAHCSVILLINNDVELLPDAVSEMLRWIDQPQIGLVGCRLHYPDGKLQHGGVDITVQSDGKMRWDHVEKLRSFEEMKTSKSLGCFPAVTAACAMIKKQTFLDVGGFDEIWYPIGYSDTNLAVKVAVKGLKCFYTPYAVGVHHESISRKTSIEDFENSWWLHNLLVEHGHLDRCPLK